MRGISTCFKSCFCFLTYNPPAEIKPPPACTYTILRILSYVNPESILEQTFASTISEPYPKAQVLFCKSSSLLLAYSHSPLLDSLHAPSAGAFHSLQRLRDTCDLVVVTSRQHIIQQPTLKWLSQHFPDTFAEVHFGNHWALSGTSRKKSEICR